MRSILGIIGGSGIYDLPGLEQVQQTIEQIDLVKNIVARYLRKLFDRLVSRSSLL